MLSIRISLVASIKYYKQTIENMPDNHDKLSKTRLNSEKTEAKKLLQKVIKWIDEIDENDERLSSETFFCPNRFDKNEMIIVYNAIHHDICMMTDFREYFEQHFDVAERVDYCKKLEKKVKSYLDTAGVKLVPISENTSQEI